MQLARQFYTCAYVMLVFSMAITHFIHAYTLMPSSIHHNVYNLYHEGITAPSVNLHVFGNDIHDATVPAFLIGVLL